jgi:hypothetical protein
MVDFNLGKLIYEFSKALIEEKWKIKKCNCPTETYQSKNVKSQYCITGARPKIITSYVRYVELFQLPKTYRSNQHLVKISDKHFVKFSKTNVIYHYFGSNNRTKMSDRQYTKESYKRRFYKRNLQYGTFFYDLPRTFDIREDWNKVLFNYLNHIAQ